MALSWPTITEGQWNLIAENVTEGTVIQLKSNFDYFVTYVPTGATAPIDSIKDKSTTMFQQGDEKIQSSYAVDVYVWPENSNKEIDSSPTDSIQVSI